MTEKSSEPDQNAKPEDIATLYSRANVEGNYWDFSASRKEARGQQRQRHEDGGQIRSVEAGAPGGGMHALTGGRGAVPEAAAAAAAWPVPQQRGAVRSGNESAAAGSEARPVSGEGTACKWFGLQSLLAPSEAAAGKAAGLAEQPPVTAVFSFAGGVGKTCMVATLGRALAALGERVLLADTATCGLLGFYFGSREFKPGVVRTFSPPPGSVSTSPSGSLPGTGGDAPVQILSLEAERYPGDGGEHDPLLGELVRDGRGTHRVLVDVATASREVTKRLLLLRPVVLVPILPDMSSVASLESLETFLAGSGSPDAGRSEPVYVLNQFDASVPLHVDVRQMLRRQLGERLLPFVLHRSTAVSEALAEGMTVIDYAPGSAAAEDYWKLADWVRGQGIQAATSHGGARWSER